MSSATNAAGMQQHEVSDTRTSPDWLSTYVRQTDRIYELDPFPFDQPQDTRGYLALHQNDYLRLAGHPAVTTARRLANDRGAGAQAATASVFGSTAEECRLTALMATKLNAGAVLLTTAGWAANGGLVEAITPPERPVYIDREAHASLYDGARLAGARAVAVRHNESADLETKIAKHGPGVVCIDALYSGDGSIPDLEAYVRVCEERDCVLILDEAHSFGILGADGGGLAAGTGLTERVHFRTGSLKCSRS